MRYERKEDKKPIIADIIKYFKENEDIFNDCMEELDSYNGYLGDDRYYDMDELNDLYGGIEPQEILFRAFYGFDADIEPIELHDGINTISTMLELHKQCAAQQGWLENRLCETQRKICDIEHAIEFYNYNARDGYKMYKRLKELRLERRKYKDALLICEIMAGTFAAVDWAELSNRLPNLAERVYKPRFYPELFENNA